MIVARVLLSVVDFVCFSGTTSADRLESLILNIGGKAIMLQREQARIKMLNDEHQVRDTIKTVLSYSILLHLIREGNSHSPCWGWDHFLS